MEKVLREILSLNKVRKETGEVVEHVCVRLSDHRDPRRTTQTKTTVGESDRHEYRSRDGKEGRGTRVTYP